MSEFFSTGKCRHYQLVDGWAKVWCARTDAGPTDHETMAGFQWETGSADPMAGASDD